MNRISLNLKLLKQYFLKAISVLFTVLSAILLLMSKEDIGIISKWRSIITFGIWFLIAFAYAVLRVCFYKSKEVFDNGQGKLILKYNDLWKIAFTKKSFFRKKSKKIVVVSVNTTFDTIVDEDLSKVPKPLVSENTMHGQWLKKMKEQGVDITAIDESIKNNLKQQGINPSRKLDHLQKERGNLDCFNKGTIAVYEHNNTIFYLIALSEFDENNNAQNTKDELVKTTEQLIEYYDKYGQGYDLYIPLLGTGMSRTNISLEESLQIMVSYFKIYKAKIHGNVNIIIYKKQRNKVSLDI